MAVDEDTLNIWGEFEADFEEQELTKTPILPQVPNSENAHRRHTIVDRFQGMLFNGFAFTALMALVVVVAEAANGLNPYVALTALLPCLLLARLAAPLVGGPRRGIWFYALVALGYAGACHLAVAGAQAALLLWLSTTTPKALDIILEIQHGLERYLTVSRWLLCAGGGAALALGIQKFRKRLPWVESRPIAKASVLLAILIAASPTLLIGGLFLEAKRQESNPAIQFYLQAENLQPEGLDGISSAWYSSYKTHRDDLVRGKIGQTEVQKLESLFLKLTKEETVFPGNAGQFHFFSSRLLALEPALKSPREVMISALEAHTTYIPLYNYSPAITKVADLAEAGQIPADQIERALGACNAIRQKQPKGVHFLDIIACERAEQIITDYKSALPTPLRLFGEDVPWSPSQLYVRSQLKPHLEWWLEVRPALIGMNEDELESILKQKVDNTPSISRLQRALLEGVATHYNSGALRELERAQIMLAIRLYQSENGTLPESLEQLQPLLDNTLEPGTFQLHKEGEQLVVESEARQIWILR